MDVKHFLKLALHKTEVKIDSLTLEIPTEKVTFHTKRFHQKILEVTDDGEILNQKIRPYYFDDKGIKNRIMIVNRFGKENLNITISTKMLGQNYFNGLDFSSLKKIIKSYSNMFEFESIKDCVFYDIDFCFDFFAQKNEYEDLVKSLKILPNSAVFYTKAKKQELKEITGITFNKRNSSSIQNPFFKIYDKSRELKENSSFFAESHNLQIPKNIRRFEFTFKNKKHLERYNLPNDFKIFLVHQLVLKDIFQKILNFELPFKIHPQKLKQSNLTPTDIILINFMKIMYLDGHNDLKHFLTECENIKEICSDNAASRMRTKLKKLYPIVIKEIQLLQKTYSAEEAF